ncbi:glycoside hydrolase family 16 protein [Sphingomonas sp. MMS12-HWE2-04]|uniref:glycoside hydrolase family 16 protein n=1 Tax=Sphingomonas sp. MMS12-HWE2-04 TaxID=3234199 RepID=UPI00384C4824
MKRTTRILIGTAAAALVAVAALSAQIGRTVKSGPPAGLDLVPSFAEEFDGPAIDTSRWIFGFYDPRREQPTIAKRNLWGNRERQVYFDKAFLGLGVDPFRLKDGVLTIEAAPLSDQAVGAVQRAIAAEPANVRDTPIRGVRYSSGLISTRGRFAQTFGYFEIRARWSGGKGIWPAFWLLPASGKWPPEIDILEAHGDKPRTAYHSIHSKAVKDTTKTATIDGSGQDFHLYGALWTPRTIDYYIDGVKTATLPTPPDMHQPMYLLANLAIGGSWPGYPDAETPFPATMEIDYIRAWRFKDAKPVPPPRR